MMHALKPRLAWPGWGEGAPSYRPDLRSAALYSCLLKSAFFTALLALCGLVGYFLARYVAEPSLPPLQTALSYPASSGARLLGFLVIAAIATWAGVMLLLVVYAHTVIFTGRSGYQGLWRQAAKARAWRRAWLAFEERSSAFARDRLSTSESTTDRAAMVALLDRPDIPQWPLRHNVRLDFFQDTSRTLPAVKNAADLLAYTTANLLHTFARWEDGGRSVTGRNGSSVCHVRTLDSGVQFWAFLHVQVTGELPTIRTVTGVLWWIQAGLLEERVRYEGDYARTRRALVRSVVPPHSGLPPFSRSPWELMKRFAPYGGLADAFLYHWSPSFGDVGDAQAILEWRGRRQTQERQIVLHSSSMADIDRHRQLVASLVDAVCNDVRTVYRHGVSGDEE